MGWWWLLSSPYVVPSLFLALPFFPRWSVVTTAGGLQVVGPAIPDIDTGLGPLFLPCNDYEWLPPIWGTIPS